MPTVKNWTTATESKYPWERDALEFVRTRFPTHEPYRAWANFEFIADDGSINEVDLLLFTSLGFFLVEIGPLVFNAAVQEAQQRLQERVTELDIEIHEQEFGYWPKVDQARSKLRKK